MNDQERIKRSGDFVKGVFCDTYNLYLKYHGRDMDQKIWDECISDYNAIMDKYQAHSLCSKIVLSVLTQLEDERR